MKKKKSNLTLAVILILLVFIVVAFYFWNYQNKKATVDLYGTSLDTNLAVLENDLIELKNSFGDRLKINIHLLAFKNDQGDFISLLESGDEQSVGPYDLDENRRQLVIQKHFSDKYFEYLKLKNLSLDNPNWQDFTRAAGIDPDKVEELVEEEGDELLNEEIENYKEFKEKEKYQQNLPAIYINEKIYQGNRDLMSLAAAIAKPVLRGNKDSLGKPSDLEILGNKISFSRKFSFSGINECYGDFDCNDKADKDGTCENPGDDNAYCKYTDPEPTELTVLTDDDCLSCNDERAVDVLKKDFKGLYEKRLDIDSGEGRELIGNLEVTVLPIFLFDSRVSKTPKFEGYSQSQALAPVGEAGDNFLVTNVMPLKMLDREKVDKRIDLMAASLCPYSAAVENALIEKLRSLPEEDKFDLRIHFILNSLAKADGTQELLLESPRGDEEIEEDKRQVVMQKYYSDKYFDYLIDRNNNPYGDWKEIANNAGLPADEIEARVAREGESLLRDSASLPAEFGLTGVPAYFYENQQIVLTLDDLKKLEFLSDLDLSDSDLGVCQVETKSESSEGQ